MKLCSGKHKKGIISRRFDPSFEHSIHFKKITSTNQYLIYTI